MRPRVKADVRWERRVGEVGLVGGGWDMLGDARGVVWWCL